MDNVRFGDATGGQADIDPRGLVPIEFSMNRLFAHVRNAARVGSRNTQLTLKAVSRLQAFAAAVLTNQPMLARNAFHDASAQSARPAPAPFAGRADPARTASAATSTSANSQGACGTSPRAIAIGVAIFGLAGLEA